MSKVNLLSRFPFIFLGIAEYVKKGKLSFPFEPIDIIKLSKYRSHFLFPISLQGFSWVFLIHSSFIEIVKDKGCLELEIRNSSGQRIANVKFEPLVTEEGQYEELKNKVKHEVLIPIVADKEEWIVDFFTFGGLLKEPGEYGIYAIFEGISEKVGSVIFRYQKAEPYTLEQLKAIESDPYALKSVRIEYACNFCPSKIKAYTGLERERTIEEEGYYWQQDLPDFFNCECGKQSFSLRYAKESLHGFLGIDRELNLAGFDVRRKYSHEQILQVIRKYDRLLEKEDEKAIQKFIEKYPVMLARFHAKRIYVKPEILGKFQADFGVLDTQNQLKFIEIESPKRKLFKKDGHPTVALMHAYGQVVDWLDKVKKHPLAVIESLGLKTEEVNVIKGVVMAGLGKRENQNYLQRHLSNPTYPDVEFMTLDSLSKSLLTISRLIAKEY